MPGPEISSLEAAGAPPLDDSLRLPGQIEDAKLPGQPHEEGREETEENQQQRDVRDADRPAVQFQTLGTARKSLAVEQDLASIREEASIKGELELDELKARTMYQMVEDMHVHNMEKKLLFLTNPQANLISGSKDSIRRLLDAFDITAPKLVINLLRSKGTIADLRGECEAGQFLAPGARKPGAWLGEARVMNSFPWMSHEEAILAEKSLDSFMANVLIPLATENNAVVITECMHGECFLSSAFHRMMLVQAKKWGGRPPVTVLAIGADLGSFYNNPNLEANWREVKRKSKSWTTRERQVLKDIAIEQGKRLGERGLTDMDPNAANYIICDSVDRKGKNFYDKLACNSLKTELVRYLMEDMGLPSIAMKTGCTFRRNRDSSQKSSASLAQAIDCVEAGQQVLFLDLRERKLPSAQDRGGLIEQSKTQYTKLCNDLISQNEIQTPEVHDVMTAAFFRDVLRGDASSQSKRELHFEPLCVAIRRCRRRVHGGISSDTTVGLPPASAEQIQEVSWWLAKTFFEDEFVATCKALKDGRLTKKWLEGEFKKRKMEVPEDLEVGSDEMRDLFLWTIWEDRITTASTDFETLFNADGFHACNVNDLHSTKRLVTSLIKIDRLPVETPLEGLELLRQAWKEHDVAVYLGSRYSLLSDFFYLIYLALGACTVTLTVFHAKAQAHDLQHEDTLSKSIFFLALASAFLLSVSSFVNPTQRSRQLLSAAASIESIVWRYRARVSEFARDGKNALAPEHALRDALTAWRESLVASSDLDQTSFKKPYNENIYQHYQYSCSSSKLSEASERHSKQSKIAQDIADLEAKMQSYEEEGRQESPSQTIMETEHKLVKLKNDQATFLAEIYHMDDFQSPVKPDPYIAMRLQPAIQYYQQRIPSLARWRMALQCIIFVCTGTSATLSYLTYPAYVAIVSATSTAVGSWIAFQGLEERLTRSNSTVRALELQLSWWHSLSDVDKASVLQITELVQTSEQIITAERMAWQMPRKEIRKDDAADAGTDDLRRRTVLSA